MSKYQVGGKVKFVGERKRFTIQAMNERFLICTHPHFKTVMYCIVDLQKNIRAPDNQTFCSGYESQADCQERLKELVAGEICLSRRYEAPLEIQEYKAD